jgi:hypothetical protein
LLRATNGLYEIRKVLHEIEKSGGGFLSLPRQSGPEVASLPRKDAHMARRLLITQHRTGARPVHPFSRMLTARAVVGPLKTRT